MNPNMPPAGAPVPARSGSTGFIIATVILLVVIVAAVTYFWKARSARMAPATNDAALQQVETQSSSDSTSSIEADLKATNVDTPDSDLNPSNFTSS